MQNTNKKYVCISIQSTAQFKYWNHPGGWESVVRYLNSMGYEVYDIDRDSIFGGEIKNKIPKNTVNKTGLPLDKTIGVIKNAEFFIGISSGLSWLAWAVGVPVILISGITPPFFEFQSGCVRVFNPNVCNSCFCDVNVVFDKGDWMFCPHHKNTSRQFECTTTITPEIVIDSINKIIKNNLQSTGIPITEE